MKIKVNLPKELKEHPLVLAINTQSSSSIFEALKTYSLPLEDPSLHPLSLLLLNKLDDLLEKGGGRKEEGGGMKEEGGGMREEGVILREEGRISNLKEDADLFQVLNITLKLLRSRKLRKTYASCERLMNLLDGDLGIARLAYDILVKVLMEEITSQKLTEVKQKIMEKTHNFWIEHSNLYSLVSHDEHFDRLLLLLSPEEKAKICKTIPSLDPSEKNRHNTLRILLKTSWLHSKTKLT